MKVPEQLFASPLLKDLRTQRLEVIWRKTIITANNSTNVSSGTLYRTAEDRVGCVQSFGVNIIGNGAATQPLSLGLICNINGLVMLAATTSYQQFVITAANNYVGTENAETWLPPGTDISLQLTLSPGSLLPAFEFTLGLLTFPRGNVSVG